MSAGDPTHGLTHVDAQGGASMVDVGGKPATARAARARGAAIMSREALAAVRANAVAKGDVLGVARVAGIMAAKRTADLVPLCHQLPLAEVRVELALDDALPGVRAEATARAHASTGVEMEAIVAVTIALVTVYDMVKAVDPAVTITDVCLVEKTGGRRGPYRRRGGPMSAPAAARPAAQAQERVGVAEASARIMDAVGPLPPERVALADALARVLADDVVSPVTLPPWANSAMDGYAVRAADVAGASRDRPARLPVAGTVAAGGVASSPLAPGAAVRIMTGAPVPDGADSVVRVEDTDGGETVVAVCDARDAGRNVRPRGEDLRAGDVAVAAGTALGPAHLGVLAACGAAVVGVHRRPRVALLTSGDELVELDRWAEALAGRRVVSTNSHTLAAAVRLAGGEPVDLGIAADRPEALEERLRWAAGCDLLVTSAGNSVGAFDHTRAALAGLGATLAFSRVRLRPGAPLAFGTVGGIPWLGLPGNPVSALVTCELFVRPLVRRLLGHRRPFRAPRRVVLDERTRVDPALTHLLRVRLTPDGDAPPRARLTGAQGSNLLTSMAAADALLVIPEGSGPEVAAGTPLAALPLDGGWEDAVSLGI